MDIKKICRLCFKSDIQNEFIDMQAVPGLCEEAALVYGLEVFFFLLRVGHRVIILFKLHIDFER